MGSFGAGGGGGQSDGLANLVSIAGATVGIGTARSAKKTAKHAKERSIGRQMEIDAAATTESRASTAKSKADRLRLLMGAERNLNLFSSPMGIGGQAATARKTLVGH